MLAGWVGPLARSRFAAVAGVYVLGIALAGALVAGGVHRLAVALMQEPATQTPAIRPAIQRSQNLAKQAPISRMPSASSQTLVREASMLPLQDRWYGEPRYRGNMPFGSSSRGGWGRERNSWGDDEEQRPRYGATFRSVCVRLCDGYYFPVSFSVTSDRLERDAKVCASRCGNQGRLFVHNNPSGSADDMVDLAGRPYRQLKTAFLYRTEYVASCTCQPQPWEAASQDRHRGYALALAASKGNREAMKELVALQSKMQQAAKASEPAAASGPAANPATPSERVVEMARRDGETFMRLGGGGPKTGAEPQPARAPPSPPADPDWMKRAWQSSTGN